jgi:hypothetical protein
VPPGVGGNITAVVTLGTYVSSFPFAYSRMLGFVGKDMQHVRRESEEGCRDEVKESDSPNLIQPLSLTPTPCQTRWCTMEVTYTWDSWCK